MEYFKVIIEFFGVRIWNFKTQGQQSARAADNFYLESTPLYLDRKRYNPLPSPLHLNYFFDVTAQSPHGITAFGATHDSYRRWTIGRENNVRHATCIGEWLQKIPTTSVVERSLFDPVSWRVNQTVGLLDSHWSIDKPAISSLSHFCTVYTYQEPIE